MDGLTFDCPQGNCPTPTGAAALQQLGLDSEPGIAINLVILAVLTMGYLFLAFWLMKLTTKRK
jgi:hypothetical protein